MQLVEKDITGKKHGLFKQLDNLGFLPKNLYNYTNYTIRHNYILERQYLDSFKIQKRVRGTPDYQALPAKVAQQVVLRLHESLQSFLAAGGASHFCQFVGQVSRLLGQASRLSLDIAQARCLHYGDFAAIGMHQAANWAYEEKLQSKLSKYKHETAGRNVLTHTSQAVSKRELTNGYIKLSMTDVTELSSTPIVTAELISCAKHSQRLLALMGYRL
jgi:putative transposase